MHEITEAITSWIADYGLFAVFALSLIDAVLPAASELVMVYAGALAVGAFSEKDVSLAGDPIESTAWAFVAVSVAGTVGYVLGSVGGWAIGRYGGRGFVERRGRWLHFGPERLERADRWFERYGDAFVFVGRVLPVIRSFVAIPAGIARMPLGRYTVLTFPGSAAWCFALAGVGWALGANWERFHHAFRYADYAVAAVVVGAVVYLLLRKRSSRLARRADAAR